MISNGQVLAVRTRRSAAKQNADSLGSRGGEWRAVTRVSLLSFLALSETSLTFISDRRLIEVNRPSWQSCIINARYNRTARNDAVWPYFWGGNPMALRNLMLSAVCAFGLTLSPHAGAAETLIGSNVDSRVLIGFDANAEAVQGMMPEGWTSIAFPSGPLAGANLLLVLEDRRIALDAEGALADPAISRGTALLGLAAGNEGEGARLFILRVFTTNPNYALFEGAVMADILHATSTEGPANGGRARSETWQVAPANGGQMDVALNFTTGRPSWVTTEARPYSAADPEVSRIFRYSQLVDLVASSAVGKPLSGSFTFSSTIADLEGVFDGEEEMIAIMDLPVYVREVFLP